VQRLLKKFETAKTLVPQPIERKAAVPTTRPTRHGVLYFGSTSPAMNEALTSSTRRAAGRCAAHTRVPVSAAVDAFIAAHGHGLVVEQNRDAQLRTLLITEQELDPARLVPVLHYDGTPITARFIAGAIATFVQAHNVEPIQKKGQAA